MIVQTNTSLINQATQRKNRIRKIKTTGITNFELSAGLKLYIINNLKKKFKTRKEVNLDDLKNENYFVLIILFINI